MMNGTPMIWQESDCYKEIDPNGMFFKYKKDLFNFLDNILNNDSFRYHQEKQSLERANELSKNENIMLSKLHQKLSN